MILYHYEGTDGSKAWSLKGQEVGGMVYPLDGGGFEAYVLPPDWWQDKSAERPSGRGETYGAAIRAALEMAQ